MDLTDGRSLALLLDAIKSEKTRGPYRRRLRNFLRFANMAIDDFVEKAKANPKWAEETVVNYLRSAKQRFEKREISANTVRGLKKPIKLLLEINDVSGVNWSKVARFLPSGRRYALDRIPTTDELRLILSDADLRVRMMTLVMTSSGIREGAWESLNVGHLTPVMKDAELVAGRLLVYASDEEQYLTFVTPEAYKAVQMYLDYRKKGGEVITPESPLVRDVFDVVTNVNQPKINEPKRMDGDDVRHLFHRMFKKLGFRKESKRRHEFTVHGFRKYFKTRAEMAMQPANVELLMGHSIGVSDSYYRPTEKELLADYLKAVPLLTISEAEQVRRESQLSRQQLEDRLRQLEDLVSRLTTQIGQQALAPGQTRTGSTSNDNHTPKRVVDAAEVERLLQEGWEPTMTLPNGKVLVQQVA